MALFLPAFGPGTCPGPPGDLTWNLTWNLQARGHEQPGAWTELCAPVGGREEGAPFPGPLIRLVWLPPGGTEKTLVCRGGDCRWLVFQGPPGSSGKVVSGVRGPKQGELTGVQRLGDVGCRPCIFPSFLPSWSLGSGDVYHADGLGQGWEA